MYRLFCLFFVGEEEEKKSFLVVMILANVLAVMLESSAAIREAYGLPLFIFEAFSVLVFGTDRIKFITKSSWNTAGEETGPRRTAIGARYITRSKPNTISSDRINVRSGNLGITLATKLPVSEIIRQQNHNIWLTSLCCHNPQARGKDKTEETTGITIENHELISNKTWNAANQFLRADRFVSEVS